MGFAELTNAPNVMEDESGMTPMSETGQINEKMNVKMNEKMDETMRETVESLENLELESVEAGRNAGLAGSCAKLYLPNRKRDTIEVEQEHPNRSSSHPSPPLLPASAAFEPTQLKLTKPQSSGGTIDIQLDERHLEEHQQRAQETNSGAGVSEHEHENIILASNIASVQPHTSLDTRLEQRLEKSLETVEKVGKVLEKKVERDEKGEEEKELSGGSDGNEDI